MKPHDLVYFPDPLPPLAHSDDGASTPRPVPTGDEKWTRARVVRIDHHSATEVDQHYDQDVATLSVDDGPPFQLATMFLRKRPLKAKG